MNSPSHATQRGIQRLVLGNLKVIHNVWSLWCSANVARGCPQVPCRRSPPRWHHPWLTNGTVQIQKDKSWHLLHKSEGNLGEGIFCARLPSLCVTQTVLCAPGTWRRHEGVRAGSAAVDAGRGSSAPARRPLVVARLKSRPVYTAETLRRWKGRAGRRREGQSQGRFQGGRTGYCCSIRGRSLSEACGSGASLLGAGRPAGSAARAAQAAEPVGVTSREL